MTLEQWHEIHDAYVTFFGDNHRPAAVAYADNPPGPGEFSWQPGAVWVVSDPPNLVQIFRHRALLERNMLYGGFQ